ncbi:restriction endonuclease [Mesorhizobium sp. M5C.F.Cr.IN.023.01.1.1]|uniref:restriction endonuclease n=1 Tax=Mesorhizobium sp. M5C.F.Cr.IN.023.01.1.1 TaxID=2496768 RepID=UPI0013E401A0|nr:restriction endonuclease [Mesorhizobium sp. M5C.F.Cr.IN.023.01.1.1]
MLENLLAALRDDDSIVELIGLPGTGKTALLKAFQHEHPSMFDGAVEFFIGNPSLLLVDAVDTIAERFGASKGRNLLIIDEAEHMGKHDLLEGINRLGSGPWRFSTILTTTTPLDIGRSIYITPLNFDDMSRLFEARLGQPLSREALAKLWAASQGLPQLATILADQWQTGRVRSLDSLADLLNPLAAPGLVDSRGYPLSKGSHEEKTIISDVRFVSEALLKAVGKDPNLVHALTPREFEELSAELFRRQGYKVTITPQTRDGGKDLYLAKADGFGSFLYIVECKRYAPDNPVDVGVVRSLYGVAQHERVTAAMTLTTSYFSKDALDFAAKVQYQLALKDFIDLKLLLLPYRDTSG